MEEKESPKVQNQQAVPNGPQPVMASKTNWWMIFSLILLTALLAGGGVYLLLSPQLKKEQPVQRNEEQVKPTETGQQQASPSSTVQPTQAPAAKPDVTAVDALWNKYTNPDLGFSMLVLKNMMGPYGQCYYNDKNGDKSYRLKETIVPVKIFAEENSVYIAAEYFYKLKGETKENNITYYSGCDKVTNTPEIIRDRGYHSPQWTIVVKSIGNDSELEKFLKERYGEGCSLGGKKASKQNGVFDIKILGDGKDLGETKCPLNFMTVVKYYPAKQKVAAWNIGQACNFSYPTLDTCYDTKMTDSFTFIGQD